MSSNYELRFHRGSSRKFQANSSKQSRSLAEIGQTRRYEPDPEYS